MFVQAYVLFCTNTHTKGIKLWCAVLVLLCWNFSMTLSSRSSDIAVTRFMSWGEVNDFLLYVGS